MHTMKDQMRTAADAGMPSDHVPSEANQAAEEFANLLRTDAKKLVERNLGQAYEIRPCRRVRGYVLRVPITRWTFWYPTAAAALRFARELTSLYRAECHVYDEHGRVSASESIGELAPVAMSN